MAFRRVSSLLRVAVVRKRVGSLPSLASNTSLSPTSYPLSVIQFNSSSPHVCRLPRQFPWKADSCVHQLSTEVPTTNTCGDGDKKKSQDIVQIPEPPTNCCMSGCANCVWLAYAQELLKIYKNSDKAAQEVLKAVQDPSIKAFLSIELADALQNNKE